MGRGRTPGADILCTALQDAGVEIVFGLPGSQSISFYDALRRCGLRAILTTDERAAAFAAGGYFRASGKLAAVCAIAGPGCTNLLTGLAEAAHDSAALLAIIIGSDRHSERKFRLQALDHESLAGAIVKKHRVITRADEIYPAIIGACTDAVTGEPGPVTLEINSEPLAEAHALPAERFALSQYEPYRVSADETQAVVDAVNAAERVVLYAGQGAAGAADQLRKLAEHLQSPVMTTGSGRGIISETHPLSFGFDYSAGTGGETINAMIDCADLVLALGCKFTHNGTGGFRLRLPPEKLIHVDAADHVLGANYPARLTVRGDVPAFLPVVAEGIPVGKRTGQGWSLEELQRFRDQLQAEKDRIALFEPHLISGEPVGAMLVALDETLPDEAIVVTDSGLHQALARRYLRIRSPRGILAPSDFQSMGFALPAAIGAKLAAPSRPVVALVGDGGLAMTAMELATAVREEVPLTVIVFNDGKLGLIRALQFEYSGCEYAVSLHNPDFARLAASLGIAYSRWDTATEKEIGAVSADATVRLLEVPLVDPPDLHQRKRTGQIHRTARTLFGPLLTRWLKKWLRR